MISATIVEIEVAIKVGIKISVGLAAPKMERSTIIASGITVRPEVFKPRNMICAFDAVSLSGLSSCISFIAFNPRGVAALSKPRILALKFMMIEPVAGWFRGISGNNREKNGPTILERIGTIPPFSPIFIMPSHKDIIPVRYNESSKPVLAMSNVEVSMAGKTSTS